jgi:hypothetical protein
MSGSTSFAACRVEAGFSVTDVAEEFGVLPVFVCEWNKAQPPAHVIRSLNLIHGDPMSARELAVLEAIA